MRAISKHVIYQSLSSSKQRNRRMKMLKLPMQTHSLTTYSSSNSDTQTNINSPLVKLGINIGVALEYYDFMVYGLLMPFIMPLFFQSNDPIVSTAKAFSIFALGYIARPLGGLIFGQIADRKGRRKAFTGAMMLMGIATLLIGLLPTHNVLNTSESVLPALLLIACRLAQGLSFGAELPGAITITSETNSIQKRGIGCGFVISSTSIGAISATGILAFLTYLLTPTEITSWGWRIPFLVGGTLAFISSYLRTRMYETPEFIRIEQNQKNNKPWIPLHTIITKHSASIFLGIGLMLFPAAMVITNIYFATHLISTYGFESTLVYSGMTIALIAAIFLVLTFGWLVDRLGTKVILIGTCALFSVSCQHLFSLLDSHTHFGLLSFLILWQVFLNASVACVLPWLTQFFPTENRFTGVSLCYNISYVLCALLPNVYTYFNVTNPRIISHMLCSLALLALVCILITERIRIRKT